MPENEKFEEEEEGTQPAKVGTVSPVPEGGPAAEARPQPAPEPKEIIAPEAVPVAEQTAARVPHLAGGQPVLPDGGGVPVVPESLAIQWGVETTETAMSGKPGEKAHEPAKKTGEKAVAPSEKPTGMAVSPPAKPAEKPARPPGPLLPYYPPIPPQFRGTLADIRRFIGAGELMFFAGGLVFLVLGMASFGAAILDGRHSWTVARVADDVVGGLSGLVLSAGSFFCFMMSRWKLRGAYLRNDFPALQKRLILACAAGVVFGLVLGGVFLLLAYIKADELPGVQTPRLPTEAGI